MKKLISAALCAVLVMGVLGGCGTQAMKEGVSYDGNTLTVIFEANPTTGYAWAQAVSNPSVLEFVSDTYEPKTESGVTTGTGGYEVFRFRGLKEGTAAVGFTYGQQWEGGTTGRTESMTVTVDDKGKITGVSGNASGGTSSSPVSLS
jgi:inhibitor of cysteine peptidase